MADSSLYRPPATVFDSASTQPHPRKRLWRGFYIAPPVAPALAAVLVFVTGMLFHNPNSTGTPIGIIAVPILLLTVGIAVSYLMMAFIAMPIVFFLERRSRLNFFTIHAAAVVIAIILAAVVLCVGSSGLSETGPTVPDLLAALGGLTLAIGFFVVPTASVFWLVVRK